MDKELKKELIEIVWSKVATNDRAHDINHILRVLENAENIAKKEGADLDIVVPSVLFHDAVVYMKNSPESKTEEEESADYAEGILRQKGYSEDKIEKVKEAICQCSFRKGIVPNTLEGKILQDADRLEASGAIAIMRSFTTGGLMNRPFYNTEDPFCEHREPNPFSYTLDLFYNRLLKVADGMHTKTAKDIAKKRRKFLESFITQLKTELRGE